jgi:K+-transporting ATPase A subunit
VQNFLSAASGMAVLSALIRGFVRRNTDCLGNFWVDLTRGVLYILLPLGLLLVAVVVAAEQHGNPAFASFGIDQTVSAMQSGGNREGKEVRFGITHSALRAVATTAASTGSVNSMDDSCTPLRGLVPMWLMQLGKVIYGGVGSGLYGLIVFAVVAVFVAGSMVGRTPEYLAMADSVRKLSPENQLKNPVMQVACVGAILTTVLYIQSLNRVAQVRGLTPEAVRGLIVRHTEPRQFILLGESRVNVLGLNLALDEIR